MSWLGTTVEVTIDRPLGSVHPTQDDIVYLLNYGFVADTVAADGEPIDAYVVGATGPIESAVGRVVAVVERSDDVEDKLVVAMPGSAPWTVTELAVGVHFQSSGSSPASTPRMARFSSSPTCVSVPRRS